MKKILKRIGDEISLMLAFMFVIPIFGAVWLMSLLMSIMFMIASC